MKYEITRLGQKTPHEIAATLDFARERAAKLSKELGGYWLVHLFDNGTRTLRSFAAFGRACWGRTCSQCHGNGMTAWYTSCDRCYGVGAVEVSP